MKKEKALKAIQEMPDNFELEVLIEKLIFMEKVENGLDQVKDGKVISNN